MKISHRSERIARLLKEELAKVIQKEIRDPSLGFTTITDVVLSPDLKHADVYITVLGGEEMKKKSVKTLNKAHGFIRRLVAKDLNLKTNPTLAFHLDESFEKRERIEKIIEELHRGNEEKQDN